MTATARQERELMQKCKKQLQKGGLTPLEQLRAYTLSKGVRSLKRLHRLFKRLDVNGDNKMDFKEFQGALHQQGITVPEEMERQCFDDMDRDRTGYLNSEEFIVALRPAMTTRRLELVHQAFAKLDRVQDGVITVEDLKGVYSAKEHPKYRSGEWSEDDVLKNFLNSFNGPDTDGIVTREDWENYYAGVSASIDSDAYFDLMMRQAWKL